MDIEQHGSAGVCSVCEMCFSSGKFPDQPTVDRAKKEFSGFCFFLCTCHMVEDPPYFCGRKIGIDEQAGFFGHYFFKTFFFEFIAVTGSAPVLPNNGIVYGETGFAIPHKGSLALIGYSNPGNLNGCDIALLHHFACNLQHGLPNQQRVMFNPCLLRKKLGKFFLCRAHNSARLVKKDGTITGCSGVK